MTSTTTGAVPTTDPSAQGARRFGARVVLTAVGLAIAAVPFTLLGVAVHTEGTAANKIDLSAATRMHAYVSSTPGLGSAMRLASTVFAPNVFRAVLVVTALLLVRRVRRLAIWILVTVAGEAALDVTLKSVFGRARPSFKDPLVHVSGGSFPSGHAFGSLVGCTVIVLIVLPLLTAGWRRVVIAAAALIVLFVGFSRVGLGAHYVTDVLGGWLLGVAWVALTTAAFQSWRETVGLRKAHATTEGVEPELQAETASKPSH